MSIDMQRFCGEDRTIAQFSIAEPFVVGGWEYATDGRACIRTPTDKQDTAGRKLPDVAEVFGKHYIGDGIWSAWPTPQDDDEPEILAGRMIRPEYVSLIATLPGAEYRCNLGRIRTPLAFRFDGGGQGLVAGAVVKDTD